MATSKLQALWNHPAGPKTIHFWAPTFKWGISIANIADFAKPPEKISYPQQIEARGMGLGSVDSLIGDCKTVKKERRENNIPAQPASDGENASWFMASFSLYHVIHNSELQKNWNLFSVNVAMAGTGLYQLSRKIRSVDSAWENRGSDTGANCQNNNIVGVAPVFWAREGWCGGSTPHPLSKRLGVREWRKFCGQFLPHTKRLGIRSLPLVNGENSVASSLPHTSGE
ncbi:Mitochondrial pyruvate carrier 2 [Capsicum chinense]|nr:Mitochondrial pyruvate carrier 2 [Capsicum chinense]